MAYIEFKKVNKVYKMGEVDLQEQEKLPYLIF